MTTIFDAFYTDDLANARAARDAAYADARDAIDVALAAATPTNNLLAAAPALLAAARLALDYLETLPYQPSAYPSTRAQDALHDAIVAAQGMPV